MAGQTSGGVSASVRKKGRYNGKDLVDDYLLNQIAKYVKYDELGTLARDLSIEGTAYENVAAPKDKIFKVR